MKLFQGQTNYSSIIFFRYYHIKLYQIRFFHIFFIIKLKTGYDSFLNIMQLLINLRFLRVQVIFTSSSFLTELIMYAEQESWTDHENKHAEGHKNVNI